MGEAVQALLEDMSEAPFPAGVPGGEPASGLGRELLDAPVAAEPAGLGTSAPVVADAASAFTAAADAGASGLLRAGGMALSPPRTTASPRRIARHGLMPMLSPSPPGGASSGSERDLQLWIAATREYRVSDSLAARPRLGCQRQVPAALAGHRRTCAKSERCSCSCTLRLQVHARSLLTVPHPVPSFAPLGARAQDANAAAALAAP